MVNDSFQPYGPSPVYGQQGPPGQQPFNGARPQHMVMAGNQPPPAGYGLRAPPPYGSPTPYGTPIQRGMGPQQMPPSQSPYPVGTSLKSP